MQEATFNIENLQSISTQKLTKDLGGTSLTLDISYKNSCSNCRGYSNCYCGNSYNSSNTKKLSSVQIKATIENKCNLKSDLEKALFNEELSDFSFIINNEKIPVNKFILSVRSPYFNTLFNSEFKEKREKEKVLNIKFSKETFKELIRYIYTDEVHEFDKHAFELLEASDYYQIDSLKCICEDEILKILKKNNANRIFQCAHQYRCSSELKQAAFGLIKKIFSAKNYDVPDSFYDNPAKVLKLFEIKDCLENELNQQPMPKRKRKMKNEVTEKN